MTLNSSRTSLNTYHQRIRLYSFEKQMVNRLYINNNGPRQDPCGAPQLVSSSSEKLFEIFLYCRLLVK